MSLAPPGRDIVVIGASAGGVTALQELVARLPVDLPASVFAVLHVRAGFSSTLPELLARRCALKVTHGLHGESFRSGQIYIAAPDNHLVLRPGYLHVVRGPKENGHRPSVDALFRSAAAAYGPRVIGVVLTGFRDCGTAGLLSIKARGGVAIVQDPGEAEASDMPRSAIDHVEVDHVARVAEIAALVDRLAREPPNPSSAPLPAGVPAIEGEEPGVPADFVCPVCHGVLTETDVNGFRRFRCHVGHAFSLDTIVAEQAEELERALWSAARSLEESAALAGRLAATMTGDLRRRFIDKEQEQGQNAELIRRMLLQGATLTQVDPPGRFGAPSPGPDGEAPTDGMAYRKK